MSQTRSGCNVLLALLGGVTVVAVILAFILSAQSKLDISQAGRPLADDEMNAVRQRFGQTPPCLDRADGSEPATPAAPGGPIKDVHMLAWNPGDQLVRATTPYWTLRASAWKIKFVRRALPVLDYVTLADMETCGRGVLIDRTTSRGGRVVIWAD